MIEERIALMEKQLKERFLKKYYPEIAIQLIKAQGKAEIEHISKLQELKRELRKEKERKRAKYKFDKNDCSTWWGREKTRKEISLAREIIYLEHEIEKLKGRI